MFFRTADATPPRAEDSAAVYGTEVTHEARGVTYGTDRSITDSIRAVEHKTCVTGSKYELRVGPPGDPPGRVA